jgi:hypothetical protein
LLAEISSSDTNMVDHRCTFTILWLNMLGFVTSFYEHMIATWAQSGWETFSFSLPVVEYKLLITNRGTVSQTFILRHHGRHETGPRQLFWHDVLKALS